MKVFVCGDIVNTQAKKYFISYDLKTIIQDSDLAIGNFEAPIRMKKSKEINKAGSHLSQAKLSIKYLQESGFNVLSLANNHIFDYGTSSLNITIKEIIKNNLEYIGAGNTFQTAYDPKIIVKNGIKIGLIAACEAEFGALLENQNKGGYAWINHYLIEDNIKKLSTKTDLVIFIAHTGVEEIDIPLPEWRARYKRLCELGVDVVVGHHPHVPQGYERYKSSIIFYSLGNFYFDTSTFKDSRDDSYSLLLNISKSGIGKIEFIYHKKIKRQTKLVKKSEVNFSLSSLNKKLYNPQYEQIVSILVKKLFYERYLGYYESSLTNIKQQNIKFIVKYLLRLIFKKTKNQKLEQGKMLLLLHNIRIESHRYTVQRALEILFEKKEIN